MSKKLICVIDVQNDFIDGALKNDEAIKVVPNIVKYLEENINNAYVVATFDSHYENYMETQEGANLPIPHCIIGTKGHEMNKDVKSVFDKYEELGKAKTLIKYTFGANPNEWKKIVDTLIKEEQVKEIELLGFCTDICVVSNALMLKALYPETKISVLENLCAGVTVDSHNATIQVLKSCQIYVK